MAPVPHGTQLASLAPPVKRDAELHLQGAALTVAVRVLLKHWHTVSTPPVLNPTPHDRQEMEALS
jgi:hypothetical protein